MDNEQIVAHLVVVSRYLSEKDWVGVMEGGPGLDADLVAGQEAIEAVIAEKKSEAEAGEPPAETGGDG